MALAMHEANHPDTLHLVENVWNVKPRAIVGDRPVDILWASPDCTHFSKAKGAAPKRDVNRAKRSRGLAWVILRWAEQVRPRLIFMENVEEWIDWCPLLPNGRPDPKRKGETRKRFVRELKKRGYAVEIVGKDRACDHGAPTIRQRLIMVARCDGMPIVRPEPTHGPRNPKPDLFAKPLQPYRTAAEIIDWSLPCPSIFTRKKELAPATKRRIARGMKRYVIDSARPFIVPITHHGDARVHGIDEPLRTVTTAHRGEMALATPYVVGLAHGEGQGRGHAEWPMSEPLRTVTGSNDHAVVAPFLAGCGGPTYSGKPRSVTEPFPTVLNENHSALIAPIVTKFRADNPGAPVTEPMPTITANSFVKRPGGAVPLGMAAAFLAKHYGGHETPGTPLDKPISTVTTQDHHHLVAANLLHLRGGGERHGYPVDGPVPTLTAQGTHLGVAQAFIAKYYSEGGQDQPIEDPVHTLTTKARLALVTTEAGTFPISEEERYAAWWVARFVEDHSQPANDDPRADAAKRLAALFDAPRPAFVCAAGIPIVDIGMRMLALRELYRAQGFPDSYVIAPVVERTIRGKKVVGPLPKTDGTRMCGNSVSPYQASAWVKANWQPQQEQRRAA
jgi:DNA (cytosine-5)-methyltransferase 1